MVRQEHRARVSQRGVIWQKLWKKDMQMSTLSVPLPREARRRHGQRSEQRLLGRWCQHYLAQYRSQEAVARVGEDQRGWCLWSFYTI